MKVKFTDLTKTTRQVRNSYLSAIGKFLDKGYFILGPEIEAFEKLWARQVGTRYAAGTSSGSDALYLIFRALGLGEGDEIITQGNAYNASVTAILRVGAKPRFADINSATWQMDPVSVGKLITKKTKAILPVHLYGQPCDMEAIMRISKKYGLFVVEDCAQAHGAKWGGREVGTFGNAGAFSFYPTKNLGAFGDAGAVTTNDRFIYEKVKILRNLGQNGKNNHIEYGFNMRLDPIQAIALNQKMKFLKIWNRERKIAALLYDSLISKDDLPVKPMTLARKASPVYHLYPVLIPGNLRDKMREFMAGQGIQTEIHYPFPVYRQLFYRCKFDPCPVTDFVLNSILSLPFYVGISPKIQRYVISVMKNFF